MLRSLSTKVVFVIVAGVVLFVLVAGFAWHHAHHRTRVRMEAAAAVGGDPARGEAMFIQYGCGSCHALKDVRTATGAVGPPLDGIATREIIAGHLANTPPNMEKWIRDPQQVSPGTAMPDLSVGEADARDMTAFLYTRVQ
jgi:cytochrome c2